MKALFFVCAVSVMATWGLAVNVTKSLYTFGTQGPDTYADGTPVADGETYYLVFIPTGSTAKIDNFGKVTGGGIVKWTVAARGGRCPAFDYQFTPVDGAYVLMLLDTRDADGVPSLDNGVFAYAQAANATATSAGTTKQNAKSLEDTPVTTIMPPQASADLAKPLITALRYEGCVDAAGVVTGAVVTLEATCESRGVRYNLIASDGGATWVTNCTNAAGTDLREVTLPADSATRLFKIKAANLEDK